MKCQLKRKAFAFTPGEAVGWWEPGTRSILFCFSGLCDIKQQEALSPPILLRSRLSGWSRERKPVSESDKDLSYRVGGKEGWTEAAARPILSSACEAFLHRHPGGLYDELDKKWGQKERSDSWTTSAVLKQSTVFNIQQVTASANIC